MQGRNVIPREQRSKRHAARQVSRKQLRVQLPTATTARRGLTAVLPSRNERPGPNRPPPQSHREEALLFERGKGPTRNTRTSFHRTCGRTPAGQRAPAADSYFFCGSRLIFFPFLFCYLRNTTTTRAFPPPPLPPAPPSSSPLEGEACRALHKRQGHGAARRPRLRGGTTASRKSSKPRACLATGSKSEGTFKARTGFVGAL